MRLVHDVPCSRLTLAGEPLKVPWLLAGLAGLLLLPFLTVPLGILGALWHGGGLPPRIAAGLLCLILLSVGISVLVSLRRVARRPSRIDVATPGV